MKLFFITGLLLASTQLWSSECDQDAKKFCSSIEPGRGQLARCLSDYQGSLSPACAKELKEFSAKTEQKNPCFSELSELCSDIPSDPKNFEYCLLKNESRLGQKCAADFKLKKGKIITRDVCAQDVANTCYKEVSGPDGGITRCLIRNKPKLSGFCQKTVDLRIADMRKKNPCYDDTEKFCPTQLKFIDIQDCLSKKVPTLAPNCKVLVEKENAKLKANPCYRDLATHCRPGLNPKEQGDCLTLNDEHLSSSCKQFRVVEKEKIKNMEVLCEQDRLKLCKDAPFKDGAIVKCLRKNKPKVSAACQKLL